MLNRPLITIFCSTILCSTILLVPASMAETIALPVASQGDYLDNIERPQRHQTSSTVIEQFGEPLVKHPATGEPPITRWDYKNFGVYFEGDHVIHTVLKHRRQDQQPEQ